MGAPPAVYRANPLAREIVVARPRGAGLDDWAGLIAQANALAYRGAVLLSAGTYECRTKVYLASGVTILGGPGVSIVGYLGTAGGVDNGPISSIGAAAGTTTLSATPLLGARQISVAGNVGGALVVGATVMPVKAGGLRAMSYVVRARSGAGPYLVTLDRPLRMAFASGDTVNVYASSSAPSDIMVDGRGMRISGTWSRAVEMSPARRCLVRGLVIDASASKASDLTVSFDIGGFQNAIEDVEVDGGGVKTLGIALESDEASRITGCFVTRCTGYGIALYDCVDCEVRQSSSNGNTGASGIGMAITADGSVLGSESCRVVDCTFDGNGQYGFALGNGSSRCVLAGSSCNENGTTGIYLDGTNAETGNVVTGCVARANGASQITLAPGALGTKFVATSGERSVGFVPGFNIQASCSMSGCGTVKGIVTEGDSGVLVSGAGVVVAMSGCRFTPYYGYALSIGAGARVNAVGCEFTCTDATNPVITVSGEADLCNTICKTGGVAVNVLAGGKLRRSGLFDASGCGTPIPAIAGGAFSNIGLVVLTGAVAVNYAFPWLTTDAVVLTRMTAGGVGGLAPTWVGTAGVQVAVTGTAGDTSTYQIVIGP